ncbi:MAG: FAD-dependent oxidoreductase [Chitinophagaceae bacterium]
MFSVWEKNEYFSYDYLIFGGGLVGMLTAFYIKQKKKNAKIAILERGLMPSGASSKNAGFACMGSITELQDDLETQHPDHVADLFMLRKKGLERTLNLFGASAIGYAQQGSYELIMNDEDWIPKIEQMNNWLWPYLKQAAFSLADEKLDSFGFANTKHLIQNNLEGELDTGLLLKSCLGLMHENHIHIITGCEVLSIEENKKHVVVHCKNNISNHPILFTTDKLCVCTNAFTKRFFPEEDIEPGRGQVLITKPIHDLPFQGIFHFHNGYYYFRAYQHRILFGGGRHIDKKAEVSTEMEINDTILHDLKDKLHTIILPQKEVEIDYTWAGIMAFGKNKTPIIKAYSKRIYLGVRMGGMGIAIGSEVAQTLANLAID